MKLQMGEGLAVLIAQARQSAVLGSWPAAGAGLHLILGFSNEGSFLEMVLFEAGSSALGKVKVAIFPWTNCYGLGNNSRRISGGCWDLG